jgi:hypothetical protein|tara:strand:- start:755 stop:1498 length:744 start_codon:yes stop_codon:yes gene_type:complete
VILPTYEQLISHHCSVERIYSVDQQPYSLGPNNPHYEQFAKRRYNYSASSDVIAVRLVFLKDVLKDPSNKTLIRNGRFIWCKNLSYEGRDTQGCRQISFTVDNGSKRFTASENNVLCVPAKTSVINNKLFRAKNKTFLSFSTVFAYKHTFNMMLKNSSLERQEFANLISGHSPYKAGALVAPRLGYFFPERNVRSPERLDSEHPLGIILGRSLMADTNLGREFYRVRFGSTTYERVHPAEMEIINEV